MKLESLRKKAIELANTIKYRTWKDELDANDDLESFEKRWNYMISNWARYGIVDNEKDFIKLLNELLANGETLDSFHDVAINGYTEFISIFGQWDNDQELAQTVFEFHYFYKNLDEVIDHVVENYIDDHEDDEITFEEYFKEFLENSDFVEVHDGYVLRLWY